MPTFTIKNRWTDAVLFTHECASLKECVEKGGANLGGADLSGANLGGADLRGAYLSGADLGGADLGDANLSGAYLGGADLGDAYLSGANLGGADLRGAYLSGAYLGGADLGDANLSGADLGDANLSGADLGGADLRGAYLSGADLRDANLSGAKGIATSEESIARLDEIREHIIGHGDKLKMDTWHGTGWSPDCGPEHACKTSHCLAGWAQALCPDKSMRELDPVTAGVRLIPLAAGRFWDDDLTTKQWLESRAYANT